MQKGGVVLRQRRASEREDLRTGLQETSQRLGRSSVHDGRHLPLLLTVELLDQEFLFLPLAPRGPVGGGGTLDPAPRGLEEGPAVPRQVVHRDVPQNLAPREHGAGEPRLELRQTALIIWVVRGIPVRKHRQHALGDEGKHRGVREHGVYLRRLDGKRQVQCPEIGKLAGVQPDTVGVVGIERHDPGVPAQGTKCPPPRGRHGVAVRVPLQKRHDRDVRAADEGGQKGQPGQGHDDIQHLGPGAERQGKEKGEKEEKPQPPHGGDTPASFSDVSFSSTSRSCRTSPAASSSASLWLAPTPTRSVFPTRSRTSKRGEWDGPETETIS